MWSEFTAAVQRINVAPLDRASLGDLAEQIGSTRSVLDGLEARIAVALRKLGSSEATTAETLRRRTGCSTREAKLRTRRADTLQRMPNVAEALSSGQLTGEHVSALAKAAAQTSPEAVDADTALLAQAASMPADLAGRRARDWAREHQTGGQRDELHQWQRRNRSLSFSDGEGGMLNGFARFDQVSGGQFQTLVETLADRLYRADGGRDNPHARSRAQCRHDALLSLVGVEPQPAPCDRGEGVIDDSSTATRAGSSQEWVGDGATGARSSQEWVGDGAAGAGSSQEWVGDGAAGARSSQEWVGDGAAGAGSSQEWVGDGAAGAGSSQEWVGDGAAGAGSSQEWVGDGATGAGSSQELMDTGAVNAHATGRLPASPRPERAISPGCSCGRGPGVRSQLSIVMDLPFIASDATTGRCESPGLGDIARSELERLACDADIYGLIFSGDGVPLNHGRKVRTVSPQQWRMLMARDRGCVICGAAPEWCQAHHIKPWLRGGRTDLANLALVCHAHHRWIHDNNIVLKRGQDGWKAPPYRPQPGRSHHRRTAEPVLGPISGR